MAVQEPRFDDTYLSDAFPRLDTDVQPISQATFDEDLEQHVQRSVRRNSLDECENAVAQLSTHVLDHLSGIFDHISNSLLPAPVWQHPSTPAKRGKQKEVSLILRSLRIVSAARLALASENKVKDQSLRHKIERIYQAASRYLNTVCEYNHLDDVEATLLLSELEYGRGHYASAKGRLQAVISHLSDPDRTSSVLLLCQNVTIARQRNALRTAVLMLHWYFGDIPPILQHLEDTVSGSPAEEFIDADELFIVSQIRLASLHAQLQQYLLQRPYADEKTWQSCDRSLSSWYDTLRGQYKSLDDMTDDAPVNFFIFQQQYFTIRIRLSKLHSRRYHDRPPTSSLSASGTRHPLGQRSPPPSARNDAVKIASSLRNYGQHYRFREAPLCFINHIVAAADIVLSAIIVAASEDDKNAYLHISSFFCGVLRYMAEVHSHASILLEALQQRLNTVMLQQSPVRPNISPAADPSDDRPPTNEGANQLIDGHNVQLWQWTRQDFTAEFGHAAPSVETERPRSVAGDFNSKDKRPTITRQVSTPSMVMMEDDVADINLQNGINKKSAGNGKRYAALDVCLGRDLGSTVMPDAQA